MGECSKELMTRIGMARSAIKSLSGLWKDETVVQQIKQRLMAASLWPLLECTGARHGH